MTTFTRELRYEAREAFEQGYTAVAGRSHLTTGQKLQYLILAQEQAKRAYDVLSEDIARRLSAGITPEPLPGPAPDDDDPDDGDDTEPDGDDDTDW